MRLFRNLSVGRKLAASAILAILLLGGLVLVVQRELAAARDQQQGRTPGGAGAGRGAAGRAYTWRAPRSRCATCSSSQATEAVDRLGGVLQREVGHGARAAAEAAAVADPAVTDPLEPAGRRARRIRRARSASRRASGAS